MSPTPPPAKAPGLAVEVLIPPPGGPEPLRSDVAGFIGRTRRGPVKVLVRVEGLPAYQRVFGGAVPEAVTSYAVPGYFANDGQVAHVLRLAGPNVRPAIALWDFSNPKTPGPFDDNAFAYSTYQISASSPGAWAEGAQVTFRYRREGVTGNPAVDVIVQADSESTEYLRGIDPQHFEEQVNALSVLIQVNHVEGRKLVAQSGGPFGLVTTLTLKGGADDPPGEEEYQIALEVMNNQPEVALVAMPDLHGDIADPGDRLDILITAIVLAEACRDRLVLVDVPGDITATPDILAWVHQLQDAAKNADIGAASPALRAAAVYHPWLRVLDPPGATPDAMRAKPPSGHVAGVISRLDRQRGAQHTPANEPVLEAFDAAQSFREADRAVLNEAGVNLVRCFPGQGLLVWGGRTLGTGAGNVFVAHRRIIHRLVRAIRRVAEPLVFDVNVPELWLALVRTITTVLLEAFRAGGLKGARPEEAFFVRCDSTTNPPEAIDEGRVVCEIGLAPAVPMEFILLRVSLSTEGRLEVFE